MKSIQASMAQISEDERAEIILELVGQLSSVHLTKISAHIHSILNNDFVNLLPREISLQIFAFAPVATLLNLSSVSKQWHSLLSDNVLWKQKFKMSGWTLGNKFSNKKLTKREEDNLCLFMDSQHSLPRHYSSLERNDEFMQLSQSEREEFIDGIRTGSLPRDFQSGHHFDSDSMSIFTSQLVQSANSTFMTADLPDDLQINWKYVYKQRNMLKKNWYTGTYTKMELLGHREAIYCLQFDNHKIVSGSRDDSIKIWDIESQICTQTFSGHSASVLCLEYDDRYIISGSSDSTLIIWDINTGQQVRTLIGHSESVLNLKFDKKFIVSCSKDKTIKIWDTTSGKLLRSLRGHRAAVNAVQYKKDVIVSASGDRCINIWSVRTGEIIKSLTGHTRGIACIQFDGSIIVSGSSDETIRIWDANTGKQLRVIHAHTDLVRTLQFNQHIIVSGSYDSSIKVWNFETGKMILDLKGGHSQRVFKVQFNETKIVSCSQDQKIIVWDFAKGVDISLFV